MEKKNDVGYDTIRIPHVARVRDTQLLTSDSIVRAH